MILHYTADKMITQTHSQMERDIAALLEARGCREQRLVFSMFETVEEGAPGLTGEALSDAWIISRPDFASRFADGPVQIVTSMFRRWKGPVRINPTWADVLADAEAAISDDDHVFLEGYEFVRVTSNGVRVFELFYGS